MSERENVATVRAGYEAFGRGDIDGFLELFDTNIDWITPGPHDLPTAGARRGHQQVREFFAAITDLHDFQRFEPQRFIADGDTVIVLGEDVVTVKSTGKTVAEHWAHVFTLKNGKVTRFYEYMDTSELVAALRGGQAEA